MSDLCWKCREKWKSSAELMGVNMLPLSIMHCHHEPKEKPKCWCEMYTVVPDGRGYVDANFCPECGRKL